jgi:hypothetical protein
MLPYLGISLDGKYKPALVFKEDDPLGMAVINQRLEGTILHRSTKIKLFYVFYRRSYLKTDLSCVEKKENLNYKI